MSVALLIRPWCAAGLLLATFAASAVSAEIKIYIVTDLEGASGVYQFAQTRDAKETPLGQQAMEPGAKKAIAAIPKCRPYKLTLPIQARLQYLVFEGAEKKPRQVTKEAVLQDDLHLTSF